VGNQEKNNILKKLLRVFGGLDRKCPMQKSRGNIGDMVQISCLFTVRNELSDIGDYGKSWFQLFNFSLDIIIQKTSLARTNVLSVT